MSKVNCKMDKSLIKCLFVLLFLFQCVNADADADADKNIITHYELHWQSNNEEYTSIATVVEDRVRNDINNGSNIVVYGVNNTKNTGVWTLKDYFTDCPLDSRLSFDSESFEAVDLFKNGDPVILFAYKIGCISDMIPVEVKYFAYYEGVKYSLRGSETLLEMGIASYVYENRVPQPDSKLKNQPIILDYMMANWPKISLTDRDKETK